MEPAERALGSPARPEQWDLRGQEGSKGAPLLAAKVAERFLNFQWERRINPREVRSSLNREAPVGLQIFSSRWRENPSKASEACKAKKAEQVAKGENPAKRGSLSIQRQGFKTQ